MLYECFVSHMHDACPFRHKFVAVRKLPAKTVGDSCASHPRSIMSFVLIPEYTAIIFISVASWLILGTVLGRDYASHLLLESDVSILLRLALLYEDLTNAFPIISVTILNIVNVIIPIPMNLLLKCRYIMFCHIQF